MDLDGIFTQAIRDYILNSTSNELPLLTELREETIAHIPLPQMLTGPVEGQFLEMLVKLMRAKTCLEVGTFTGYSALRIAAGLPSEGKLMTCESRTEHAIVAQKYFDRSPHGHKIKLHLGDARETLQNLDLLFDFIFIDADKKNYPTYYDLLLPKLIRGGLMVIDNALWKGKIVSPQDKDTLGIHTLNHKARRDPAVETVMLSVRDGILLIRKL